MAKITRPAAACLVIALLLAACGGATPSIPTASRGPVSSALIGPGAPSGSPGASPRRWPSDTVAATVALGAADAEIGKAGVDLQAAAQRQDLRAMRGAANGLATLIAANSANIAALDEDPATQDMAKLYRKAFPELSSGAKHLSEAITAGDSAGILAGTQELIQGLADYETIREPLADLVQQALVQQKLLVR